MYGVWRIFFGPVGVNLGVTVLALLVLVLATTIKLKGKQTRLFEISALLLLTGFLYFTLHSKLLQPVLPITFPEQPLIDNYLTFNYAATSLLTFLVFPIWLLFSLKSDVSLKSLGLKILDKKQTALYATFGCIFSVLVFLASNSLFGFRWIQEYTTTGLVLWIVFVSIISVFCQNLFFNGILFNKYLPKENTFLLAVISISAVQLFTSASLPWVVINLIMSTAKIFVTLKTKNIYGATVMGISTQLVDILIQI